MSPEKFLSRVAYSDTGCWPWEGPIGVGGYGRVSVQNANGYAHRVAFELFIGPIPDGYEIDHLCRVRNCVNPGHLEAVTPAENMRRTRGVARFKSTLGAECPHGHPRTEQNTGLTTGGARFCRTCKRDWHRTHRALQLVST